jgi:putative cell wall-binding protein
VFVATGGGFADSLAGAPAAAAADAPVLFSPPGTLVNGVASELLRLDPESVTVLGGPAVVAPRIVEQIEGLLSGDSGDGVAVERHAGDDRFGTAAAISEATYPDGADDVYVATGGRYPDGLAGAPIAASLNAPVLLSTSGSLPQATSAELQRLDPNTVTVMGGPGAVNDAVLDKVEELTGAAVQRIAGSSRFGTAVAASQFLSGQQESVTAESSTVYVATGLGWADALAGAAAAGADGAPVLLTTPGRLPDMVADELRRLAPDEVVVLGGPAAVTSRVAQQVVNALDGGGGSASVSELSGSGGGDGG